MALIARCGGDTTMLISGSIENSVAVYSRGEFVTKKWRVF